MVQQAAGGRREAEWQIDAASSRWCSAWCLARKQLSSRRGEKSGKRSGPVGLLKALKRNVERGSCRYLRTVTWRVLSAGRWLTMWHWRFLRQVSGSGFGAVVGESALVVLGDVVSNKGEVV